MLKSTFLSSDDKIFIEEVGKQCVLYYNDPYDLNQLKKKKSNKNTRLYIYTNVVLKWKYNTSRCFLPYVGNHYTLYTQWPVVPWKP